MPRENFSQGGGETTIDPFYPDGYVSSDQDRRQIIAQKEKYAASVNSINLKFPLKSYKRGFFQGNEDTLSSIREDIKVLLLTTKGERVMHKELGTSLPILSGQLFEPIDRIELVEKIRVEVQTQISLHLPFLTLQSVNVLTNEDDESLKINQIRVSMSYLIQDQKGFADHVSFTMTGT